MLFLDIGRFPELEGESPESEEAGKAVICYTVSVEGWFLDVYAQHPILAVAVFFVARAVPVVVPPVPGLALDLIGVALFGTWRGFLIGYLAVQAGSLISFLIARLLREKAVCYFVSLQKVHELEASYSAARKFWALVLLRFATVPLFDIVNYAAGLTTVRTLTFFVATAVSTAPLMFVIYFFGGLSFGAHPLLAFAFFALLLALTGAIGTYAAAGTLAKK